MHQYRTNIDVANNIRQWYETGASQRWAWRYELNFGYCTALNKGNKTGSQPFNAVQSHVDWFIMTTSDHCDNDHM
eukprot:762721-Hanusia_phi.AAC.1